MTGTLAIIDIIIASLVVVIVFAAHFIFMRGIRWRIAMLVNSVAVFGGALIDWYLVRTLTIETTAFWLVFAIAFYFSTTVVIGRMIRHVIEEQGLRW